VRGIEAEGNFVKIAAIGVYLEDAAIAALAGKWAGKTSDELASDPAFFRDLYTGKQGTRSSAPSPPAGSRCLYYGLTTISRTHGRTQRNATAGDFEKFTRVTFIWPKTVAAEEFTGKVMESRVAYLKAAGKYTDAEAAAVEEFKAASKNLSLGQGASILFTHSPAGVLTVSRAPPAPLPISMLYIYDGSTYSV
jgi:chalcone isomerase